MFEKEDNAAEEKTEDALIGPDDRVFYYSDEKHWLDEDETDSYYSDSGYGYQGPIYDDERLASYSGSKSFNDSSSYWYARSSFNYSTLRNYSPSRLFRSTFLSAAGPDNELINRAIGILRILNRTANTIADANKDKYSVQYGNAGDVNDHTCTANDSKEKIIYVPTQDVENIKTVDDEDAAADQLAGMVMTRVQLAQDVSPDILKEINDRGLVPTLMQAVENFVVRLPDHTKKVNREERMALCNTAQLQVDFYAALIAKAFLMRLARKNTIKNWGGFTPYFIKYAEKIAADREAVAASRGDALESLVNKITYNMVADEDQVDLPEFAENAMRTAFSDVVAPENIFATCRKVAIELQSHCGKNASDKISEILDVLFSQIDKNDDEDSELEAKNPAFLAALRAIAEEELSICENSAAVTAEYSKFGKEHADTPKMLDVQKSCQRLHKRLKSAADELEKFKTELEAKLNEEKVNPSNSADFIDFAGRAGRAVDDMSHAVNAHPRARTSIQNDSPEVYNKLTEGLSEWSRAYYSLVQPGDTFSSESAKAAHSALEQLTKAAADAIDKLNEKVDDKQSIKKAQEYAEEIKKLLQDKKTAEEAINKSLNESLQKAFEQQKEFSHQQTDNKDAAAAHDLALGVAQSADFATLLNERISQLSATTIQTESQLKRTEEIVDKLTRSRTAGGAADSIKALSSIHGKLNSELTAQNKFGLTQHVSYWASQVNVSFSERMPAMETCTENVQNSFDSLDTEEKTGLTAKDRERLVAQAVSAGNSALNTSEKTSKDKLVDQLLALLKEMLPEYKNTSSDDSSGNKLTQDERIKKLFNQYSRLTSFINIDHALSGLKKESTDVEKAQEKIPEMLKASSVDETLFGGFLPKSGMTAASIDHANNESKSDPEEDFVAYINDHDHCNAKPTIKTRKENSRNRRSITNPENLSNAQIVRKTLNQYRGFVNRIKDALYFHAGKRVEDRFGLRSGDLDEGSLHKLNYDSEHIWTKKFVSKLPDVAVGILVDQSGSMHGSKIKDARTLCIILAEALKQITGVRLYIYGHTANEVGSTDLTVFEHHTPTDKDIYNLGGISAHSNNYDGFAIKEIARRLNADPAKQKYLFVLSDGYPAGRGYGGDSSRKHVKSVCKYVRERLKIGLYAFAIGVRGSERQGFKEQYSEDKLVFVDDVLKCLPKIVRFLRNTMQKEKSLVALETE